MQVNSQPIIANQSTITPSRKVPSLQRSESAPQLTGPSTRFQTEVQSTRSRSQALQTLTAPEIVAKVEEKAQTLGSERISQNAEKPGLFEQLKNSAFGKMIQSLFAKKPPYEAAQGKLEIPHDADVQKMFDPGIKAKFSRNTTIYAVNPTEGASSSTFTVKKGDKCSVRNTSNPSIKYVEKYSYDANKNLQIDFKGYVFSKDITSHFKARSHKALDKAAPIFPKEPSPKDIKQGAIGDCFFLAGLSSIVGNDPSAVTKMIKDNGDGTVTVKLHDVEVVKVTNEQGLEVDQKNFKEKFITFEKSILHTDFSIREHADTSAPWVSLMEKAYAIHQGSYAQLNEGGFANDVYEALLGKPAVKEPLGGASMTGQLGAVFERNNNALFPDGEKAQKMSLFSDAMQDRIQALILQAADGSITRQDVQALVSESSPISFKGGTLNLVKDVLTKELGMSGEDASKITGKLFGEFKFGKTTLASSEELAEKLKAMEPPFSDEIQSAILRSALPVSLTEEMQEAILATFDKAVSGPRGSGQYSEYQQNLFNKISVGLDTGKIMGAGTLAKIKEEGSGPGSVGTAGEEVVKGLVGGHDFSIIGTITLKPGDDKYPGPPDGQPLNFVKVRNPWGKLPAGLAIVPSKLLNLAGIPEHGSRQYSYNEKTGMLDAKGSRDAEYLVELSDFSSHFEDIYYTS
jgi:hypothetical protein